MTYRPWLARKVKPRYRPWLDKKVRKPAGKKKKKFPSHRKGLPANHEQAHKRMRRAHDVADRQWRMARAEWLLVDTVGKGRASAILKKFPLHTASDAPFILGLVEGWKWRGRSRP